MSFADGAFPLFLLAAVFACALLRAAPAAGARAWLAACAYLGLGDLAWTLALRPHTPLASPFGALWQGASGVSPWRWAVGLALFAEGGGGVTTRAPFDAERRRRGPRARALGAWTALAGRSSPGRGPRGSSTRRAGARRHRRSGVAAGVGRGVGRAGASRDPRGGGAGRALSAQRGVLSRVGRGDARAHRYLLGLILGTIVLDYFLARAIDARTAPGPRRVMLVVSLVANLGVLAVFKYADFFGENLAALVRATGRDVRWTPWRLILPAGISFHTFQSLSYTVDVYRRRLRPTASLAGFATFVLFFPQLVAGPIVRAEQFLPQIADPPAVDPRRALEGLWRVALGVAKKLCLADTLAVTLVDRVFAAPTHFSSAENLLAIYGYALQIYLDFSAYSDIAVGAAAMLGFELPENFRAPYLAADLADFWRRWHISLSTWLRDYLYVPLGGNREGAARTYRNLLLTMLLGGLWHGAAWTFLAWGALHGVGLAVTRAFQRSRGAAAPSRARRVVATALTVQYVCVAWVFFRATSFAHAREVFARVVEGTWDTANVPRAFALAAVIAAVGHAVPLAWEARVRDRFVAAPWWLRAAALVGVAAAVRHLARPTAVPFIYFQF
ncbi:MAG: MBOAT family protein [Polyangiales bacterium]